GDGHGKRPLIQAVVLRKGHSIWKGTAVDRRADLLRECHAGIPRPASIALGTVDQHWPLRTVDAVGEATKALGIGAHPMADRSHHSRPTRWLVPVVKWDGQEDGASRRLKGDCVGPHE